MVCREVDKEKLEKYYTVINNINEKLERNKNKMRGEYYYSLSLEDRELYNELIKDKAIKIILEMLEMQSPDKYQEAVREYLDKARECKQAKEEYERHIREAKRRQREAEQNLQDLADRKEKLRREQEDLKRRQEDLNAKGGYHSGPSFSARNSWTNEWKKIRNLVDNIGVETTIGGYEKLVDCNTGYSIGYGTYKKIEYQNGVIIGVDFIGYKHFITKDGESSLESFQDIIFRDGLVIAKNFAGEKLLDKSTGKPVGCRSYKKIERVNGKIFGTNAIGRKEEIKI